MTKIQHFVEGLMWKPDIKSDRVGAINALYLHNFVFQFLESIV